MITASTLYKAFTTMHPDLALNSSEDMAEEYLETNPLVAACPDLKYVTNLFTDWQSNMLWQ